MICSCDYSTDKLTLRSSSLKSLLNDRLNFQDYSPIPTFQNRELDFMIIAGTCNGLILLELLDDDLILWNPNTRQVNNNIPPPPQLYDCIGFGYDDSIDDYKIVTISISDDETSLETHILKTNSWNKIDDFYSNRRCPMNAQSGKYLNGKLHWKGRWGDLTTEIVSLDLAKGKYDIMDLPPEYIPYVDDECFWGYLCLVGSFDVWFMKEYGDPQSWTSTRIIPYFGIPKWLAQHGDVSVALSGSTLIIYDQRNKLCMSRNYRSTGIDDHCIYVETSVSPFGRQDIGQ